VTTRRTLTVLAALAGALLVGCESEPAADIANRNLTKAADNFEVPRRITAINTRNPDKPLFVVEGFCSYETGGDTIQAICLIDRATGEISRTTLGKASEVTFVVTQLQGVKVDLFRPRVIFRPETIVPNFDLSTSGNPTEGSNLGGPLPTPAASPR
jgi:hypothetical protein